jgi:hypothetical protein
MEISERQPRFLKWSLIFAIAIVANLFVNYALSLGYKAPVWNDFCPNKQVNEPLTKDACIAQGGQWNGIVAQPASVAAPGAPTPPDGYCDVNYTCQTKYSDAIAGYDRNVFIVLIVVGVALIFLGSFVGGGSVLKTSLSFSGSLSVVIASIRYWGEAHDWLKVLILGAALAALIALAVKKFSEKIRP